CRIRACGPRRTLSRYTTLFRSYLAAVSACAFERPDGAGRERSFGRIAFDLSQNADIIAEFRRRANDVRFVGFVVFDRKRKVLDRSEEHTSELQSRENLVCRLLL